MENLNPIVLKYIVFQLRDRAKSLSGTCISINYVPLQKVKINTINVNVFILDTRGISFPGIFTLLGKRHH